MVSEPPSLKTLNLEENSFWEMVQLKTEASLCLGLSWYFDFPGGSDGKSICLQFRRPEFIPWIGKIPWRRIWQPTLVFLPGKSRGQRSLVGYSPWGRKELGMTERFHFIFTSWSLKVFPRTGACWFPAHSSHFGINIIRGPGLDPLKEAGLPVKIFQLYAELCSSDIHDCLALEY